MRSVERAALALLAALLAAGCAGGPAKSPVAAVQETVKEVVAKVAPAIAASAPSAVARADAAQADVPVDARTQRAFDEARAAMRTGRAADAERMLRALVAEQPALAGVQANLGIVLRNAGKLDESAAALELAAKASPDQPVIAHQLGYTYRVKGDFAKARTAYERALALDGNYAEAHLSLGILLDLYLNDGARALPHYERYIALAPAGDAAVAKWIADLKGRSKPRSDAAPDNKVARKGMP